MARPVIESDQFLQLFLSDTPFLDVRAEGEFAKGCFPFSYNVPILDDEERHLVGTCYKQQGQEEAIQLGHKLVSGDNKATRIKAWCDFKEANPAAAIFCWRGGMRSNLSQQWIDEAGVEIPLIKGGFKALRNFLLAELERLLAETELVIIGGRTGSAKTPLINQLPTGLDLEGFAHHRGSSFGRRVHEPPSQVSFENQLIIAWLKCRAKHPGKAIFLEDESQRIGPLSLPLNLWQAMLQTPVVEVEVGLEERVKHILQEYVIDMRLEFDEAFEDGSAYERYQQHLLDSLYRIRKKLGMQRYGELKADMENGFAEQLKGDVSPHESWIRALLIDYYDPMYDYQLSKKNKRVSFKGSREEVMAWANAKLA